MFIRIVLIGAAITTLSVVGTDYFVGAWENALFNLIALHN